MAAEQKPPLSAANTERLSLPPLGNALGYFLGLWAISRLEWLDAANSTEIVAMMGVLCIYALQGVVLLVGCLWRRFGSMSRLRQ